MLEFGVVLPYALMETNNYNVFFYRQSNEIAEEAARRLAQHPLAIGAPDAELLAGGGVWRPY